MPLTGSTFIFGQSGKGSGGGGGTSPGGSPTQLQFNNTVFGGVPGSVVNAATGEITLTTVTGIILNIVQQDVTTNAVMVSDGAGDLFDIYTQGGVTAFNLADSATGAIALQTASGFPSLTLTDMNSINSTLSETGLACSAALNLSSGTDIDIVAGTGFAVDASTTVVILNEGTGGSQYTDTGGGGIQFNANGHNVELNLTSGGTLSIHGTQGVTAGPFTTITSITVINGIVTALTGA